MDRNPKKFRKGQLVTCKLCNRAFRWGVSDRVDDPCHHEASIVKKDNNFRPCIRVSGDMNQSISNQLREDVDFLCSHGLMDYSVLLGYKNVAMYLSGDLVIRTNLYSSKRPLKGRKPGTGQAPYASSVIQGPGLVFIGIIDYLQKYTLLKKLERFWKVIFRCKDRNGISDLPPDNYKNRIMERVIGKVLAFLTPLLSALPRRPRAILRH